jgi:hypothetical protein
MFLPCRLQKYTFQKTLESTSLVLPWFAAQQPASRNKCRAIPPTRLHFVPLHRRLEAAKHALLLRRPQRHCRPCWKSAEACIVTGQISTGEPADQIVRVLWAMRVARTSRCSGQASFVAVEGLPLGRDWKGVSGGNRPAADMAPRPAW